MLRDLINTYRFFLQGYQIIYAAWKIRIQCCEHKAEFENLHRLHNGKLGPNDLHRNVVPILVS